MNFKPILPFFILWIPVSWAFFTSSVVSPLVKFSATYPAWNTLCSVVFGHVLHINIIVLSHSQSEDTSVLLKHIQRNARKSVAYWNADGLVQTSVSTLSPNSSFCGTSTKSGFIVLLDNTTSSHLRLELELFWRRVGTFITPNSPVIMLISSEGRSCDAADVRSLDLPLDYHTFVILSSCADRVFFFDVYDDQSVLYLTEKNLSKVHDILRDLTANMKGSVLRVAMADFFPSAVFKSGTNVDNMTGVDAYVLQAMARYFNFTPKVVVPKDGLPFGVYINGTGSGTIRSVVEKEADVSFIGRFVMDYGTNDFDFTQPYQFDSLCVIVPKNPPFKMYKMLVMSFEPNFWLLVGILHVTAAAVWLGIKSLWLTAYSRFSFVVAYFDVYFLSASGTIASSALKSTSARFFAASLYFFNLVFIGTLQGMIYKFTASPIQRQMHTLQELDESGLLIETIYEDLVNTFPVNSEQEVIQSLRTKVRLVLQETIWTWKPGNMAVAALLRKNPAALSLSLNANPNIVLVEECPRNFFLSYVLRKNHKILPYFNQFIYRCSESGLLNKWLDDTYIVRNSTFDISKKTPSEGVRSKDASLEYVAGAVFILSTGLLASSVVFVGEMVFAKIARIWKLTKCLKR